MLNVEIGTMQIGFSYDFKVEMYFNLLSCVEIWMKLSNILSQFHKPEKP